MIKHEDGGWIIRTWVDSDWHLNISITNEDGTDIEEVDEDFGCGKFGEPFNIRLTTSGIETVYFETIREKINET